MQDSATVRAHQPLALPIGLHLRRSAGQRQIRQELCPHARQSPIQLRLDLRQRVVATEYRAAYSPPGHLVYIREARLVAQPFDATRHRLSGEPTPIVDDEIERSAGPVPGGAASFSLSTNGVLAWLASVRDVGLPTWFDRGGRPLGTIGESTKQYLMDLSPDEKTLAVCVGAYGTGAGAAFWQPAAASMARSRRSHRTVRMAISLTG